MRAKNRTIHEPPSPDKYIVVLSKSQDSDSIPSCATRVALRRFVVGIIDSAAGRR
ncbi:putative thiamine-phosphate pyrophosphorylase [Burkholderia thailandensis]|uniref:Thiamine-phosphate pyrophosphorylase n=1 Tax=Burkholderia thailandensis TaxID=57975 RepID=A0AAW9D1C3_BURTH|nr:putative thiamine-phosphate pyrophosphorylase [Burkholderia thailandensis]MDW9253826.1 putative thiamine-phosphate pyrophosphorylase [Burkholderia thailandensis]